MKDSIYETTYLKQTSKLSGYAPFPYYLLEFDLSMTARIQYCLLLNRAMLSRQNGWVDEKGNVFVYYSETELGAALHKGRSAVQEAMRVLDKTGLISRRHIKGERTRRIYPKVVALKSGKPGDMTGKVGGLPLDLRQVDDWKSGPVMIGKPTRNKHTEKSYISNHTDIGEMQTGYGSYKNILLTDEQMQTLREKYPDDLDRYIEEMSTYMAANGRTYQNCEAALVLWAARDTRKSKDSADRRNYDCDEGESL